MLFIVRFLFAFLGVCALVFAWQFALAFSQMLIASNISTLFFTSLLFSMTSVAAAMVAFHAMRNAPKMKAVERLVFVIMYVVILLPSIVMMLAMKNMI